MIVSARDKSGHYRHYRTMFYGLSGTPQGGTTGTKSIEEALPTLPADATYIGTSDTPQGTVVQMPDASEITPLIVVGLGLLGLWWAMSQKG